MKAIYADVFKVSVDREYVSLVFGREQSIAGSDKPMRIPVSDQIVLSPQTAKALYDRLGKALVELSRSQESASCLPDIWRPSPERLLPQPPRIEGSGKKAQLMFELVDSLGVHYGFENSYKLLENKWFANRFLLGFKMAAQNENLVESVLDLCKQIEMPEELFESFRSQLTEANIVLFGFEENENTCLYKVYLEFGNRFSGMLTDNPDPFQIHAGYKWDALSNRGAAIARYICYPAITVEHIMTKLAGFYGKGHARPLLITTKIINRAATRTRYEELLYAEVHENDNPRHSFDINLYRANMRLYELYDLLSEACEHYLIPLEAFNASCESVRDQIVGHVSGGIDRMGRDFLTIYFGVFGSSSHNNRESIPAQAR